MHGFNVWQWIMPNKNHFCISTFLFSFFLSFLFLSFFVSIYLNLFVDMWSKYCCAGIKFSSNNSQIIVQNYNNTKRHEWNAPYKPFLHVLKVNKDCDKWTSWLIYFLISVYYSLSMLIAFSRNYSHSSINKIGNR